MRVIFRHDREKQWQEENPVLHLAELAVSFTDNGYGFKLGDGKTQYRDLPFIPFEEGFKNGCLYTPWGRAVIAPIEEYPEYQEVDLDEFEKIIQCEDT